MNNTFICPNCETKWDRHAHYSAIIDTQNLINIMMGNKEIIDMCGKCNHFVYKEKEDIDNGKDSN